MKYLLMLLLLLSAFHSKAQENDVVHFIDDGNVYIRWGGVFESNIGGYNIYRSKNGENWELLTNNPQQLARDINVISVLADYKTELFLALFGIEERRSINDQDFNTLINNNEAIDFLKIMSLVNPEFGYLLGTIYVDSTWQESETVQYRITVIRNETEETLVESDIINPAEIVPVSPVEAPEAKPGDQKITLSWPKLQQEMSEGEVVTYNVYAAESSNGQYNRINNSGILSLTVTSGDEVSGQNRQSFTEKFLNNEQAYYFYIKSVNAFGFESVKSPTVEAIPSPAKAPMPPFNISLTPFGRHLKITWDSREAEHIKGYKIFRAEDRNEEFEQMHPASELLLNNKKEWTDLHVNEGGHYYYYLQSIVKNGISSRSTDTLHYYFMDTTPPAAPQGLIAEADTGVIRLSWEANKEDDIAGYYLERSADNDFKLFVQLHSEKLIDTNYTDSLQKESETTYGYRLIAIDRSGNRSLPSNLAVAKMPDVKPPIDPIITSINKKGAIVQIKWTESSAEDFKEYRIYRSPDKENVALRATVPNNSFSDTLQSSGTYFYTITAIDENNNESEIKEWRSLNYDEFATPIAPDSGYVEVRKNRLVVIWSAVDRPKTKGFMISREDENGTYIDLKEVPASRLYYVDLNAKKNKQYSYYISTFDTKRIYSEPLIIYYSPEDAE